MGIFLVIYLTLTLLCELGANTQGAPTKGRYMWVKCRTDEQKNTNCVTKKGPWMALPEPNRVLSAANKKSEGQSDDGSGTGQALETGSGDLWEKDGGELGVFQPEEASTDLDSSPELDYSEFVFPQKVYRQDKQLNDKESMKKNQIL